MERHLVEILAASLAVCLALGAHYIAFGLFHWARLRSVSKLARPSARVDPSRAGEIVVLLGRLEAADGHVAAGDPLVSTWIPGGPRGIVEPVTTLARPVALVMDGARVAVDGPVDVLVGSIEASGAAAQALVETALASSGDRPAFEPATVRIVASGAQVRARGRLERGSDAGSGAYRTQASSWTLVPEAAVSPASVSLAATRPTSAGEVRSRIAFAAGVGGLVLAAMVLSQKLSSALEGPVEAAATHRAQAYAAWLEGDVARASRHFLDARSLDDRSTPSITEIEAHLITGKRAESASLARHLAELARVGRLSSLDRDRDRDVALTLECYAADVAGGAVPLRLDPGQAAKRLGKLAGATHAPVACHLLHADGGDLAARGAILERQEAAGDIDPAWEREESLDVLTWLLLEEAEGERVVVPRRWIGVSPEQRASPSEVMTPLHRAMLRRAERASNAEAEAAWRVALAGFESMLGNHREAALEMSLALQRLEIGALAATDLLELYGELSPFGYVGVDLPISQLRARHRRFFAPAARLATRAGYFAEAAALFELAGERSGAPSRAELDFMNGPWSGEGLDALGRAYPAEAPLWDAAKGGDGRRLVRVLRDTRSSGRGIVPLVARTLPAGRSELAGWVAREYPDPCATCGVGALVDQLSARLAAASAAGATPVAQRLEHVLSLFGAILRRRDITVPLAVLDRMGADGAR